MPTLISENQHEPWRRRLFLPNYQIGEAARYADISTQAVAAWHKIERPTLSLKERRAALSYMQLIEVAVVAAFRKAGISLRRIRDAREYIRKQLNTEYPFAEYSFKTEGKHLFVDYQEIEGIKGQRKTSCSRSGRTTCLGRYYWAAVEGV